MKKSLSLQRQKLIKLIQSKKNSFFGKQVFNKQYGTSARIAAMHNIQRASGRRGN